MRILISEDQQQYVGYFQRDLHERYGHDVVVVSDPQEAVHHLDLHEVDVAVIDLMYEEKLQPRTDAYRERRTSLAAALVTSGLTVIRAAADRQVSVVVWTSGEANRHLHLIFAYEQFAVRAICSKTTGNGADHLHTAVLAAAEGRTSIDPLLQPFVPPSALSVKIW